jgi:signal transduction histidine kinase
MSRGGTAPNSLHAKRLAALNRNLVRLVAAVAAVTSLSLVVLAVGSGDGDLAVQALGAALVAAAAGVQILIRQEHAAALLAWTTAVIIVTTSIVGSSSRAAASSTALAIVGMVASLFVDRRIRYFVAAFAILLIAANFAWHDTTGAATAGALISALAFTFGVLVFAWLRAQLEEEAARFRHLFARAPVSIWEEDFTEVGEWLADLREGGVDDLLDYLDTNPSALAHAASLIKVNAVNDAAVELLEADLPDDLVGRLRPGTLTPQSLRSMVPQLIAVWNEIDHIVLEVRDGKTLTGERLEGLLSWTAPMGSDGLDLSRVIVAIVDVTASRRAQEDLEALVRSRDELIATVSHELRTPLTTVVGLSHELRDAFERFDRNEVIDLVDLIAQQSSEVATIVEDLLVAARAAVGSLDVSSTAIDLAEEAASTLSALGLDSAPLLVTDGAVPAVVGDPGRVRQILRNLVVNAQRYGGPEIRVVVTERGALEIRDSGPPLPSGEVEAIFSRYYRSHQTPGVTASVGLGLTVSRELARLMGGDITYHHDGEAVFSLTLPRATGQSPAAVLGTEYQVPITASGR